MATAEGATSLRHLNPAHGSYFADPFVWKHGDQWYAVGTGELEVEGRVIGRVFPILHSANFFEWHPAGGALERPEARHGDTFWAPAVAEQAGTFYLYYSVGHRDKNHQLRVAASDAPQGPYRDLGRSLLSTEKCSFAIDPHPFQDEDGAWYLFYARDFLDEAGGYRPGTGLVAARLWTMTELQNEGRPILRARWDWQRFRANRLMYGRVWDWHTLEGPCVQKHDGRYYCLYSGGCWENETYGVDFAVADQVLGPYSDEGSEAGPRVLQTVPGELIGPGHNTIVPGPDGKTFYIAYHAWDRDKVARRMFLDPLVWTESGPRRVVGPERGSPA